MHLHLKLPPLFFFATFFIMSKMLLSLLALLFLFLNPFLDKNLAALLSLPWPSRISMGFSLISFHSFSIHFYWHWILAFLDLDTSQEAGRSSYILYSSSEVLQSLISPSFLHLFLSLYCSSAVPYYFQFCIQNGLIFLLLLILMFWKAGTWCLFLFHCPIRHQVSTSS